VGLRGHVDGLSRYAVRGWAADDEQPERPVEVSISLNGAEVTRVVADHPREDLRRLGNLGEGKHGFSYKFTPPIPTTKHCLIVVTYAGTTEILPMGSITLTAKDPEFIAPEVVRHGAQPLLITGHARSGSTIMMRRLVEHPQIAVANLHPYEIKMMAYYSAAYRVLTAQGDRLFSSSPETLESNKFFIGYNPYFDISCLRAFLDSDTMYSYFEGTAAVTLRTAFQKIIEDYYRVIQVQRSTEEHKFFAEKNDIFSDARTTSRIIFDDLKEVVLIRDLRDVFCSSRSFFKSYDTPVSYIRDSADKILSIYKEHKKNVLFVKYEDLIIDDKSTLKRLADHLEIAPFLPLDESATEATFQGHGTSASPLSSIGRWREELTSDDKTLFARELAEFLATFDYEI
jgi:hypothetical protein